MNPYFNDRSQSLPTLPFFLFFILSCATLPRGSPMKEGEIFRLRGNLKVITPSGGIGGALVLISDGKERTRVEFLAPLGGVMGVFWMAGEEWILWDPAQRSAFRGTVSEVLSALLFLHPLYRNGIVLTLGFLTLTEHPPFATLKQRVIGYEILKPSAPLPLSDGAKRVLYDLPSGKVTVEHDPRNALWQVTDGLWTLNFQEQDLAPFPEGSAFLLPRPSPGTSWRSFSELIFSSPPPAPATAPPPPLPGEPPPPQAPPRVR